MTRVEHKHRIQLRCIPSRDLKTWEARARGATCQFDLCEERLKTRWPVPRVGRREIYVWGRHGGPALNFKMVGRRIERLKLLVSFEGDGSVSSVFISEQPLRWWWLWGGVLVNDKITFSCNEGRSWEGAGPLNVSSLCCLLAATGSAWAAERPQTWQHGTQ